METQEQIEFAKKYHTKKLRFTPKEGVLILPAGEYMCSAALYKWENDDSTILGLIRDDGFMYAIHMAPEELESKMALFEVLPEDEDSRKLSATLEELKKKLDERTQGAK